MPRYTQADVPDQTGRSVLVTGANTGIGFTTAKMLAAKGADVILACRSAAKGNAAMAQIQAEYPDATVRLIELDLTSLASVDRCVSELQLEQLDLLINNAGIMMPPYELTEDGFESQFGVNHLGHFALTGLLMDALIAGAGRIVTVSSLAATQGRINFADINAESGYEPFARYAMSKMANLLFTMELARRFTAADISCGAVACHPGATATELGRHAPSAVRALTGAVSFMFNTPEEGALPTLLAATHQPLKQASYYGPQGLMEMATGAREVQPHIRARDEDIAARLWDLSVELTGVDYEVLEERHA